MSKHYTFQHPCRHTAIGPLLRCSSTPSSTGAATPPPTSSDAALQSINIFLPLPCPFCTNTQSYQNVLPGSGLLAILEPSTTSSTTPSTNTFPYEWRVLRVCRADDVSAEDWYLAHGPDGCFRQMAWIPNPCGGLQVGAVEEGRRNGEVVLVRMRRVDCSWRQMWGRGEVIRTRLPGMLSRLNASLMGDGLEENIEGLGL
jgi:hypothetical protein